MFLNINFENSSLKIKIDGSIFPLVCRHHQAPPQPSSSPPHFAVGICQAARVGDNKQ